MYEPRRQGYLKAMGITPWRRRARDAEPSPQSLDPRAAPFRGADSPAAPTPPGDEVAALDWPALRERVRDCRACELRAGCTQTVFGVGDTAAKLLVIGEAPGADEDRQGEPFVGRAGQLLNAMLKAMGFGDEDLPLSLQIAGPRCSDYALLQAAQLMEEALEWPGRYPDLAEAPAAMTGT
jgi:DNA polymerase